MIPTAFDYQRATSLDDALAKLAAAGGGKFLAGGHSLVPLMKLRLSEPQVLIDIARIPGLAGIRESGRRASRSAPARRTTTSRPRRCSREACPVVAEAAADIGDPQVRNRGTLGGSLAHADPSADYPAVMLALDAEIHLEGTQGLARREGRGLLPGTVHRGPGARRDHRQRAVRAGAKRPPTPSCTSARRTSPSSASPRRSRSRRQDLRRPESA